MENREYSNEGSNRGSDNHIVIPVIEEQLQVDKEVVETGRVSVRTRISEEETTLNMPVVSERYEVKRVPVNEVFRTPPPVRHEGDTMIVPVVEEILVVEKRYKVIEEVHIIKEITETPYIQQVVLQKQDVTVERTTSDGIKSKL